MAMTWGHGTLVTLRIMGWLSLVKATLARPLMVIIGVCNFLNLTGKRALILVPYLTILVVNIFYYFLKVAFARHLKSDVILSKI